MKIDPQVGIPLLLLCLRASRDYVLAIFWPQNNEFWKFQILKLYDYLRNYSKYSSFVGETALNMSPNETI